MVSIDADANVDRSRREPMTVSMAVIRYEGIGDTFV